MSNTPELLYPEEIYIDHIDVSKVNDLAGWWDCCPDNGIRYTRSDNHENLKSDFKHLQAHCRDLGDEISKLKRELVEAKLEVARANKGAARLTTKIKSMQEAENANNKKAKARYKEVYSALALLVAHDVAQDKREGLEHCLELQKALELINE